MAEAKDCPVCRLVNPPEALRCDCGYDWKSRRILDTYLTEKDVARGSEEVEARTQHLSLFLRMFKWW